MVMLRPDDSTMTPARRQQLALRKAFVASLSGTSLEYYDFAVYSSAAALRTHVPRSMAWISRCSSLRPAATALKSLCRMRSS